MAHPRSELGDRKEGKRFILGLKTEFNPAAEMHLS